MSITAPQSRKLPHWLCYGLFAPGSSPETQQAVREAVTAYELAWWAVRRADEDGLDAPEERKALRVAQERLWQSIEGQVAANRVATKR